MLSPTNAPNGSYGMNSEDTRGGKIKQNDFYDEVNVDQYHTFEGPGAGQRKEEASFIGID